MFLRFQRRDMKTLSKLGFLAVLVSLSLSCSSTPTDRSVNSVGEVEKVEESSSSIKKSEKETKADSELLDHMNRIEFRSFNRR